MVDEDFAEVTHARQQPEPEEEDWPGLAPKQSAFLNALVFHRGHKSKAAKSAKIARSLFYRWLEEDAEFKAAFVKARKQAFGALEDFALERSAVSDGILGMMLRAGDPRYRASTVDHRHEGEVTHKFEGPFEQLLALYHHTVKQADAGAAE